MKISQVISRLQDMQRLYGDLDVYVRREPNKDFDDNDPELFTGFVSLTGNIYSYYDFTHFEKDYPEKEQFDLEKDKLCII